CGFSFRSVWSGSPALIVDRSPAGQEIDVPLLAASRPRSRRLRSDVVRIDTISAKARHPRMASSGKVKIEALKTLLDSAREIVAGLADESMERALRALADLPADEREVIALALDRAVTAWRANEAFAPLHKVQMRANPHAQLFVRVFDP